MHSHFWHILKSSFTIFWNVAPLSRWILPVHVFNLLCPYWSVMCNGRLGRWTEDITLRQLQEPGPGNADVVTPVWGYNALIATGARTVSPRSSDWITLSSSSAIQNPKPVSVFLLEENLQPKEFLHCALQRKLAAKFGFKWLVISTVNFNSVLLFLM